MGWEKRKKGRTKYDPFYGLKSVSVPKELGHKKSGKKMETINTTTNTTTKYH